MLVTALEANIVVPNMETVVERLLHEEQKTKEKDQGSTSAASPQEVMSARHKKRRPRCYFCNKLGHKQRNCYMYEREKKLGLEGRQTSNQKMKYKVNSVEMKCQHDDTNSDKVVFVVQHALSTGVHSKSTGTKWIIGSGATCHVCNDSNSFVELNHLKNPLDITL